MRTKTVFFDLDGTLWPPHSVVLPAYRRVFRELALPVPSDDLLLDTLGYQNADIWQRLLPETDSAIWARADRLMEQAEHDLIRAGHGQPFPGVSETLAALQGLGCQLHILSNCGTKYLQAVPDALGIGCFFAERFCAGGFPGLSKAEIMASVLPRMSLPAAMVGDRWHDIAAGRQNGLFTVGCSYGVGRSGELVEADRIINSFPELLPLLV